MEVTKKLRINSLATADAEADIGLINEYSLKELSPDEVYTFSVVLCDNEVDRDLERFSDSALEAMATLFVGKTGISDHDWSASNQVARIYRTSVVTDTTRKTMAGSAYKCLVGDAYMLRNDTTKGMIEAIEGGILKEVSVGCAMKSCTCSVCGGSVFWDGCEKGHVKGESYDGQLCHAILDDPSDAYEFSFVAVPAQRGAGVTKAFEGDDVEKAFQLMLSVSWSGHRDKAEQLMDAIRYSLLKDAEKALRQEILNENKKYLKGTIEE